MNQGFSVYNSPLHACGVRADVVFQQGSVVLQEKPFHFLQTLPNRKSVVVCTTCLKSLGPLSMQMGVLQGIVSRQNMKEEADNFKHLPQERSFSPLVSCSCNCGEVYCSEQCREHHWSVKGHRLLCTGLISDDEADDHPLINFKVHAMTTNEIFLMVADIFASMCCHIDNLLATGVSLNQAFDIVSRPLAGYVRELWWDAAITPKGYKPAAFKKSLKTLVKDSYELLSDVLQLEANGYNVLLSEEYMSRTIGMFEQNNVGVQMRTHLAEYIENLVAGRVTADPSTLAYIADATTQILDNIDDNDMCCDEDEEGEEGSDGDDEGEGGEEEVSENEEEEEEPMETGPTVASEGPFDENLAVVRELVNTHGIDTLFPPLDGTAFYALICRINHSCDPNVRVIYVNSPEFGLQAHLLVLRPIQPGEELLQSYIDQFQPFAARQKALKDYGFECTCTKCIVERGSLSKA